MNDLSDLWLDIGASRGFFPIRALLPAQGLPRASLPGLPWTRSQVKQSFFFRFLWLPSGSSASSVRPNWQERTSQRCAPSPASCSPILGPEGAYGLPPGRCLFLPAAARGRRGFLGGIGLEGAPGGVVRLQLSVGSRECCAALSKVRSTEHEGGTQVLRYSQALFKTYTWNSQAGRAAAPRGLQP